MREAPTMAETTAKKYERVKFETVSSYRPDGWTPESKYEVKRDWRTGDLVVRPLGRYQVHFMDEMDAAIKKTTENIAESILFS